MRYLASLVVAVLSLALAGTSARPQSMYDDDLSQYSSQLRALMARAERTTPRDEAGRAAIQRDLLALSKRLHRLDEEAIGADVELRHSGKAPDRQLLLAASIAEALDLAQSMTGNYLDTRDKVFWSSALTAARLARTLQAAQ